MIESILKVIIEWVPKIWHKSFSGKITFNFFEGGITTVEHTETERIAKK